MSPKPTTDDDELMNPDIAEAMGISPTAFEEIQCIIGRIPTIPELSTLLAMWDANGRQQSLYGWLKGQPHTVEHHEYLYAGKDEQHKTLPEPRVKDCVDLAHEVVLSCGGKQLSPSIGTPVSEPHVCRGDLFYLAGNISTDFLDSTYARKCLHVSQYPVKMDNTREDIEYLELILGSLRNAGTIRSSRSIKEGGLFTTLVWTCLESHWGQIGFEILTCREVRLDAFLFGEEIGRYLVVLPEEQDDFFLLKMQEAGLNCCFLGHTTKGRVLVDDLDYGPISGFAAQN